MIEALRVLKSCRNEEDQKGVQWTACPTNAVSARRLAWQLIQNNIVSAPDQLREQLRAMTRMQLIRALAAARPDLTDCRNVSSAYRIALKSLGR